MERREGRGPVRATPAAVMAAGALSCAAMGRARATVTLLGVSALATSATALQKFCLLVTG